jgi:hypothetical protein
MAEYRRRRLAELQSQTRSVSAREVKPVEGIVHSVESQDAFLEETGRKDTVIVVHLTDDIEPACHRVDALLGGLSGRIPLARVVRAPCAVVAPHFDPVALPAILVYWNGTTLAAHVALARSGVEGALSVSMLEELVVGTLRKHGLTS